MSVPKNPKAAIGLENARLNPAPAEVSRNWVPEMGKRPPPSLPLTMVPSPERVAVPAPGKLTDKGTVVPVAKPSKLSVPTPFKLLKNWSRAALDCVGVAVVGSPAKLRFSPKKLVVAAGS